MFCLKHVHGFGRLRRRGIAAVRAELTGKVIVYNLLRSIMLREAGQDRQAMCHGDLGAQDLMESDGIKFIDLEMAGENDLHFDLAMFILFNGLSAEEEARFLGMYGPGVHLGEAQACETGRECQRGTLGTVGDH